MNFTQPSQKGASPVQSRHSSLRSTMLTGGSRLVIPRMASTWRRRVIVFALSLVSFAVRIWWPMFWQPFNLPVAYFP